MQKMISLTLLTIFGIFITLFLWPTELTEVEKIEQIIHHTRDGIEQEILADVMEEFSQSYKDDEGGSYDMIKGLFMRQFLKNDPIMIQLSPMKISIQENIAEANFDVAIFEGEGVSIFGIPNNSDVLNFTVELRKNTKEEWKITSHTRKFYQDQ